MTLIEFTKKIIKDYLLIFAIIVIGVTLITQEDYIKVNDIYIYMIGALVGALPGFIFFSKEELSNKEMQNRIILHLLSLEVLLLIYANIIDLVGSITESIVFAVEIAIIYLLVRFLSWTHDRNDAKKINEKLKQLKNISNY